MLEESISKRVYFSSGGQTKFILDCKNKLKFSNKALAKFLKINIRTLTDWRREKFSMPLVAVRVLQNKTNIRPKNIEIKKAFWHTKMAGSLGGKAVYKKYGAVGGDIEQRKKQWCKWWEREGKYAMRFIIGKKLSISVPHQSKYLAEFVGIVMGDGGISNNQVTVTLHHKDDKQYSYFVIKLFKQLFGVTPSVYHDIKNSVNDIVVSRVLLVKFLVEKLGLVIGNKVRQQIDIPDWIKKSKEFRIACVRGLVDTDGCFFTHSYRSSGKLYSYKKMVFTSASLPLRLSVYRIIKDTGLHPRLTKNDVRLDRQKDVEKYLKIFNTHNSKHLKRYRK